MSRVSAYISRPPSRPPSEQLCDLHVYKVPLDLWRAPFNNVLNNAVTDTISLGIIRVPPDLPLINIRSEIQRQLEDNAPRDYVFLRSVGRSLTRLKTKQEYQLKAKHFLPPVHYAPELYLLEATAEFREALAISDHSSQQSPSSPNNYNSSRNYSNKDSYRYRDRDGYQDRGSPQRSRDSSPTRRGAAGGAHKGANYERDVAYTNHTNEDSRVAGLTPEEKNRNKENYYDEHMRKTREMQQRLERDRLNSDDDDEDERRRLQDLEDGAMMDQDRWDQEQRRRKAEADKRHKEEERKREEARRQEEEDRKRAKEEEEERKRRKASDEELSRFPSPPKLHMSSPEIDTQTRETESARQRRKDERKQLMQELEEARELRRHTEREREELVKKAKNLQSKTQNRRNHARDVWKKRYFEEKKKTAPLEEQTNRLQEELENLHRKLMATLEGPKEKNIKLGDNKPSLKNNYVIQCTKLQHEIDDLRRRIENAKMKLTGEMKLRNQAEAELRALRAELVQKKISLSLTRTQQFAALSPGVPNEITLRPVPSIPEGKGDPQAAHA